MNHIIKAIRQWWRRITDTKPRVPRVGALRIVDGNKVEMLTRVEHDGEKFKEKWTDYYEHKVANIFGRCPSCNYATLLERFGGNL